MNAKARESLATFKNLCFHLSFLQTFREQISLPLVISRQCEIKCEKFSKVRYFYAEVKLSAFSLIFSYRKFTVLLYSLVSKVTFVWQNISISIWECVCVCDINTPTKTGHLPE